MRQWITVVTILVITLRAVQSKDDQTYLNQMSNTTRLAFQTQRDIGTNITIDQLIWPGVNLTSSGQTAYDLLTLGYRRLQVDLTWHNGWPDLSPLLTSILHYLDQTRLQSNPQTTDLILLDLDLHQTPNASWAESDLALTFQSFLDLDRLYRPIHHSAWPHWLDLIARDIQLIVSYRVAVSQPRFRLSSLDNQTFFQLPAAVERLEGCPNRESWKVVTDRQFPFDFQQALAITQCNASPFFSQANYSRPDSIYSALEGGAWADNVLATMWSWDVNEPRSGDDYHCAALQKKNGRWKAMDCSMEFRVICRSAVEDDVWILTKSKHNYDRSLTACPERFVFDIPRIPRQNKIVTDLIQAQLSDEEDHVWINLNLVYNMDQCWAVGRYGTCWWLNTTGQEFLGLIKTSIVAGVIVLILVGIFIWIKCARLWRNRNLKSRRAIVKALLKKREYVTVPA